MRELTPAGLDYVFFTGSGSEAADTSLKMARAYWRTKGQASKTLLIGREKGYHGVNFGGISVGGIAANRKMFGQGIAADHLPHTPLASNALSRGIPTPGADPAADLPPLIPPHQPRHLAAAPPPPLPPSAVPVCPPVTSLALGNNWSGRCLAPPVPPPPHGADFRPAWGPCSLPDS